MQAPDLEALLAGKRGPLARAITLIESQLPKHRQIADQFLSQLPRRQPSQRIGITGPPGAGKSTLIEALGLKLLADDPELKLAVLAVDPSSHLSGGSILGDKTRMEELSRHPRAYIRPSPNSLTLGGVARRSYETIALCEAAGYHKVLVETVGVGQAETVVSQLVDTVLLVALPGAGDELQGVKRGIMETADLVVVNKADGERKKLAAQTLAHHHSALRLLGRRTPGWQVPVVMTSALELEGIDEALAQLEAHWQHLKAELLTGLRRQQDLHWFDFHTEHGLLELLLEQTEIATLHRELREQVAEAKLSPTTAARKLLSSSGLGATSEP